MEGYSINVDRCVQVNPELSHFSEDSVKLGKLL